jgi:RNA polymerase sigma factor (sigma-70 family)
VTGQARRAAARRPDQARDEEITAFYAANHRAIRRYLIACGCPEHEADDMVQDSILAVRDRWAQVRSYDKPVAYWYKAAGNRFRRVQGQRARRYAGGDYEEHLLALPDPVDHTEVVDRHQALMARILDLPPRQRQVLWLRLAAGFSEAETAGILSIRPGTVKSQLHDAKARLEELLRKDPAPWEEGLL